MAVTTVHEPKTQHSGRSDTEAANELFLERVQGIQGISRIEVSGDALADRTFRVHVQSRREVGAQLYELEAEIFQKYPNARFELWVTEAQ